MWMTVKIGWRNVWRNRRRSLIMLGAVVVGLWGLVMIYGTTNGMMVGMVDIAILAQNSHLQVHAQGYQKKPELGLAFAEPAALVSRIATLPHVRAAAPRAKVTAMLNSARDSAAIMLVGIDPPAEAKVSAVAKGMKAGRYFAPDDRQGILIGAGLAKKLKTGVGKKLVIYARGTDQDLKLLPARVVGVFDTGTDTVDKYVAFVPLTFFQENLGLTDRANEIAVRIDDNRNLEAVKGAVAAALQDQPGLEVLTWKEMFPFLVQIIDVSELSNYMMLVIVGIAMSLGIANTMVMSVYERFRELGIMKAVGTRPVQIFFMVLVEAGLLAATGLALGSAVGWVSFKIWSHYGLDLSIASASLKMMGIPTVIYPQVYLKEWVVTWLAVLLFAVGASLYPAFKAARLRPVEAMRL